MPTLETEIELENRLLKMRLERLERERKEQAPKKAAEKPSIPEGEKDWSKVKHTCPSCKRNRLVVQFHGFRKKPNGKKYMHSYCTECRGEAAKRSYHAGNTSRRAKAKK